MPVVVVEAIGPRPLRERRPGVLRIRGPLRDRAEVRRRRQGGAAFEERRVFEPRGPGRGGDVVETPPPLSSARDRSARWRPAVALESLSARGPRRGGHRDTPPPSSARRARRGWRVIALKLQVFRNITVVRIRRHLRAAVRGVLEQSRRRDPEDDFRVVPCVHHDVGGLHHGALHLGFQLGLVHALTDGPYRRIRTSRWVRHATNFDRGFDRCRRNLVAESCP